MATAPRKTAAKKVAAPKPVETVELEELDEVDNSAPVAEEKKGLSFNSKPVERELLCTLDDDIEITIPKTLHAGLVMKFMNELRKSKNEMFAAMALLEGTLGAEQFDTLTSWEGCDDEVMGQILEVVVNKAFGQADGALGE